MPYIHQDKYFILILAMIELILAPFASTFTASGGDQYPVKKSAGSGRPTIIGSGSSPLHCTGFMAVPADEG